METKRRTPRFIRVLWLTLAVWPFVNLGGGVEKAQSISSSVSAMATCQASSLVDDSVNAGNLGYDVNKGCVVGSGGCKNENF